MRVGPPDAAWTTMFGQHDMAMLRIRNAFVRDHMTGIELDLDLPHVSRISTRRPIHATGTE